MFYAKSCTEFLNVNKLIYFKGRIKVKHQGLRQQDNTSQSHFSFSYSNGKGYVKT